MPDVFNKFKVSVFGISGGTEYQLGVDSSGRLSIGTIAAGTNYIGKVRITDGTYDLSIVDPDWGGGLKALPMVVAEDSGGQTGPLRSDSAGRLYVHLSQPSADTSIVYADPTFTTKFGLVAMGIYPGDGSAIALQVADDGLLSVAVQSSTLPTGAATSAKQDTIIGHVDGIEGLLTTLAGAVSGSEMQVDVLSVIPGTGATNLGKSQGASASNGDTGVSALAVRDDATSVIESDGDYSNLRTTSLGHLWITPNSGFYTGLLTGAVSGTTIDNPANKFSLQVAAGTATTWTVVVEVSNDGSNWSTAVTHTNVTPGDKVLQQGLSEVLGRYWRVTVTAISNGSHTLTVYAQAVIA